MTPIAAIRRQRLIAPRVRSEAAADQLLRQMRLSGSDKVLPRSVWLTATELPHVIASENGGTH